ncbi:MAG: glutamine-hydrolyzing GMP synthase, partial [Flavobacteriales bacterium]
MHASILILDFGSQVTQLIARRIREMNVYCEIHPWNKAPQIGENTRGVILSGSPYSVHQDGAPHPDLTPYMSQLPLLGICYGAQWLAQSMGGEVVRSTHREYGRANLQQVNAASPLFKDISIGSQVWMSHGDTIISAGANTEIICSTADVHVAGFQLKSQNIYGVQFHPEVYHSTDGAKLLQNFVLDICRCNPDWTPNAFVDETVASLQEQIGEDEVILGLSGGVDSTVAAMLI